jgi:tetratricopeptide (TPR) repeat protein
MNSKEEYDTEEEVENEPLENMNTINININKNKEDANYCVLQGKYDEAITIYNELLKNDNKNPVLLSNRSVAYHKMGCYDMALRDCIMTTKLKPDWGKAWGRLGANLYKMNRMDDALTAYTKANELDENPIYIDMIKTITNKNNISIDLFDSMMTSMLSNNKLMSKMMDPSFQTKILTMQSNPFDALNDDEVMGVLNNMMENMNIDDKMIAQLNETFDDPNELLEFNKKMANNKDMEEKLIKMMKKLN